jgi:hypothetical protein
VLSLRYTTGLTSPGRTGQDSVGVDNPRYGRFSYQDHETGPGRGSIEVAAAVGRHLVTRRVNASGR